ncbi:DNA polymerase beta domain protein region [Gloeothece citriformis PCC 7424]|uniref:DNA polymerase beta domain protein region n=1 Tax=Gloeothece citriformis (strain PCC 7424) TaxID=65393 RepID=B7KFG1_GLOC7|nr:nucleotidyltransferase domain-containing protein [Gloeothece citriformis]ACK71877.1 DNA polymerase beta domain protein region [Gloeothece citriformis PCC 7424]
MAKIATELIPLIEKRTGLSSLSIASFCEYWQITKMALFGSVLRSDFNDNSDIDVLLKFAPNARQGLLTLARIKHQLEEFTGREVDLLIWQSIEKSENPIRQAEILSSAQIIYEQR